MITNALPNRHAKSGFFIILPLIVTNFEYEEEQHSIDKHSPSLYKEALLTDLISGELIM
jgi:hypothetical protein